MWFLFRILERGDTNMNFQVPKNIKFEKFEIHDFSNWASMNDKNALYRLSVFKLVCVHKTTKLKKKTSLTSKIL